MRVLFMGTPDIAVGTLEKIIDEGHEVIGVVTQPDKPKGRGKNMKFPPVKEAAAVHNIPIYQPTKVRTNEFARTVAQLCPDVIVVIAFGQIIPKSIIELPQFGCINVHASLLPKYRGAAPIQWAIIDGEKESGVTTMKMDEGIDTGDMIMKTVIPLDVKETYGSLADKISAAGAQLLVDTLKALGSGTAVFEKQGESQTAYAKMLDKKMGEINWNSDAVSIERWIRGLNPRPSAYTFYNGKTLKIWAADVLRQDVPGKPGQVVAVTKDTIVVKTNNGLLSVHELQLEGKKRMTSQAFLPGYPIAAGSMLGR